MMTMKREREVDSISMANYLMMLSRGSEFDHQSNYLMMMNSSNNNSSSNNNRVFECKTCNRQFSSFQALGGHRASHKKPRLMEGPGSEQLHGSPPKPKTHECSICGLEFSIGQALGGHMRRHRSSAVSNGNMHSPTTTTTMMSNSSAGSSVDNSLANEKKKKKANNNSKRSALFLDLNLTPFENDLQILKIGQPTPLVDCFN